MALAAIVMSTATYETTGYSPFKLVFRRPSLGCEGLKEILDPITFNETVQQLLQRARKTASEKVSKKVVNI